MHVLCSQVTGGANFDLEMSLAEGAGLRGGYSTVHSLAARLMTIVKLINIICIIILDILQYIPSLPGWYPTIFIISIIIIKYIK